MSKLPVISGMACVKALEKLGFLVDRQRVSLWWQWFPIVI